MNVKSLEVGMVSGDRRVVDFLAHVFELDERPPREYPVGTLHRLQAPGAVIKVMVPRESPADADGRPFLGVKGFRYLTLSVTDLDRVTERCIARGGVVVIEAFEPQPGTRLAMITDPDGNTVEITETS